MKIELESCDIQAIAASVFQRLEPILLRISESTNHEKQQPMQLSMTDTTSCHVLNQAELTKMTRLSTSTIWRLEKAGQFPQRVKLSLSRVGWIRSEVEEWISYRQQRKIKPQTL